MASKRHNKFRINKIKNTCSFCCSVCSSKDAIHLDCIQEYLAKNGYIVLAHPFMKQEVYL